jgi:TolB-like protein/DNA-binding winged helix-turn-helix (wHTH) protein/Tfp pilus assembly protein PilF
MTTNFQVDDWAVFPGTDRISRGGEEIRLEPRVMTVLCLLAAHAGEVVSRDTLDAGAWEGMVVGYDSLPSCINKLRKALGDDSHDPHYIQTVPKKGYRLIAPVSVEEKPVQAGARVQAGPASPAAGKQKKTLLVAAAVILGLAMLAFFQTDDTGTKATKPVTAVVAAQKKIAVLPFTNITGDPEQDYFIDGITDDLITDLSGLSGMVVISRSASSQYRGMEVMPIKVGQELGAEYLLEGSVRKSGDRWRINVKLVNSRDGTNLWARRFENSQSSLFEVQDEVARSIIETLAIQLNVHDRQRLGHRPTTNFDAYESFLLGQKLFKVRTRESNLAAQDAYRKAIRLDPNFARAYGALAVTLDVYYWRGWSDTPGQTLERALEMARYAVELDQGSPQAHWALGYTLLYSQRPHKAVVAAERALELAPNYADGYGLLALIYTHLGDGEKALQLISKGKKINPHYSWDYPYIMGRAYYILEQYPQATENLLEALDRNENAVPSRIYLAAAYMAAGKSEEATWEVEQIKMISPEMSIGHLEKNYPVADDAYQARLFAHLRQAGLPEE